MPIENVWELMHVLMFIGTRPIGTRAIGTLPIGIRPSAAGRQGADKGAV